MEVIQMREIKFRGKATMTIEELNCIGIHHENGWIIGNLVVNGNQPFIVGDLIEIDEEYIIHEFWASVDAESVGQYTGVEDKDGVGIYEKTFVDMGNVYLEIGRASCRERM